MATTDATGLVNPLRTRPADVVATACGSGSAGAPPVGGGTIVAVMTGLRSAGSWSSGRPRLDHLPHLVDDERDDQQEDDHRQRGRFVFAQRRSAARGQP